MQQVRQSRALASVCALIALAVIAAPRPVAAVTTAECLQQTHNPTAVKNCQTLLDGGTRSVAIYMHLAEALNSSGERAESYQKIEEGLKYYPGNDELVALKAIVRSNLTEQEYLDAQNRRGPSAQATSKAKLRILRIKCLKKDGQEALDACVEFITLGGEDAEIDQKRQSLLASLPSAAPPPAPVAQPLQPTAPPPEPEPEKTAVIELTPTPQTPAPPPPAADTTQADKDREAYQRQVAMVKSIQTALNELGFPAGTPDGLSGSKTRRAIEDFYAATDIGPSQPIGPPLLQDLQRAQRLQRDAQALHGDSRRALANGDALAARDLLESARQLASWVSPDDALEQRIDSALDERRQQTLAAQQQQQAEQADRQRANELLASATTAIVNDDLQRASELLDQAEALAPSVDSAAQRRQLASAVEARARARQQQQQLAAAELQRQIKALEQRASLELDQGNARSAEALIDDAKAIDPDYTASAELQQRLRLQLETDRANDQARSLLGEARDALAADQLDRATALTQQARQIAPDLVETDTIAAQITRRQSEIDAQKAADSKRATETQQLATVATLLSNARSELNASNRTAARAIAEEVLALQPGNADALSIIQRSNEPQVEAQPEKLAELLQRGQIMLQARQNREAKQPDYFTETLPASIGKLFE